MKKYATIRYSTKAGPDQQSILRIEADSVRLKNFGAISFDLSEVGNLKRIARLDIGDNRLKQIDLTPLYKCRELRYLDLSGNQLNTINLESLVNCRHLERLDLSHNNLDEIDLTPLNGMKKLKELFLHANNFSSINATPLIQCYEIEQFTTYLNNKPTTVFIGHEYETKKGKQFHGDPLLEYSLQFRKPSWLNSDEFQPLPKIASYKALVKKFGWQRIKLWTLSFSKMLGKTHAFPLQTILLEHLGIPELACYDGPLEDIINLIPESVSFQKGTEELSIALIDLLKDQLEHGGSTLFFDIDSMSTRDSSVLLPLLLAKRKEEMENVQLKHSQNMIDLSPLWVTGYGYEILRALGVGRKVALGDFHIVAGAFKEIGVTIEFNESDQYSEGPKKLNVSKSMMKYILTASN